MPDKLTLDEAIHLLSESAYHGSTTFDSKYRLAQIIGIEAILHIKAYREQRLYISMMPLKGELLP